MIITIRCPTSTVVIYVFFKVTPSLYITKLIFRMNSPRKKYVLLRFLSETCDTCMLVVFTQKITRVS